jgi:hypothetical protein
MQELCDPIKRPKLGIMGIKEGEKVQAKDKGNIFNKIIAENSPNHPGTGNLQDTKHT